MNNAILRFLMLSLAVMASLMITAPAMSADKPNLIIMGEDADTDAIPVIAVCLSGF